MSDIAKIGPFSDGGYRIRVVTPGNNADPAPSDPRQIVFDSDWPEIITTASGYYGSAAVTYSTSNLTYTATWAALGYVPFVSVAIAAWNAVSDYGYHRSRSVYTTLSSAYLVSPCNLFQNSSNLTDSGVEIFLSAPLYGSSNTYTVAWGALLVDTGALGNVSPASRSGTTYMSLSAEGPVVAKPGKDVGSTNLFDFLIPPPTMGAILGQTILAGTVSSLPNNGTSIVYNTGSGNQTFYEYLLTIPHNLGYTPFAIVTNAADFRTTLEPADVFVDETNIYLHASSLGNASDLSITPTSYFVFRPKWF
jgi:hypothetical protein